MLGGGFYSHNSRPQRAAATAADAHLAAAAAVVPLPDRPTPALVGDFGCAGGANEMAPLAVAVDGLRARDATLPIEVAHTDLPQNDFGPLFALLQGPSSYLTEGVYPYVVGRTLYGPLFPDRRLHLGWSAITLHWLSSMPVTVPTASTPTSSRTGPPATRSPGARRPTGARSSPNGPGSWSTAASSCSPAAPPSRTAGPAPRACS